MDKTCQIVCECFHLKRIRIKCTASNASVSNASATNVPKPNYLSRRAYPASGSSTSPNHNYNHTAYVSSRDDITNVHDANGKEYQNL